MKKRQLSLKIIIAAGFILIILISGAISLSTFFDFKKIQRNLSSFNSLAESEKHISNFLIYYLESQVVLNSMLTVDLGTEEADFRTSVISMQTSAEHLTDTISSIKSMTNEYSDTVEQIIRTRKALSTETDFGKLLLLDKDYETLSLQLSELNHRILTAVEEGKSDIGLAMEKYNDEQNSFIQSYFLKNIVAFIILIVAGALIAFFTARAVVVPVNTLTRSIAAISSGEGDLTRRIRLASRNEMGVLGMNVNTFIAKIHDIVFRMKEVSSESRKIGEKLAAKSEDIGAVVEQMAASMSSLKKNGLLLDEDVQSVNRDVSEIEKLIETIVTRIEEQSSAVNESSAAVEEMIASVTNISNIAESKQDIIRQLENTARNSEEDMEETLSVIKGIASNADLIMELIQVINAVADQTNLLAMNAAIEAAHAGDAGRGFAVVADEIRKLAETTSNNAADISKNLTQIIGNIKNSAELTEGMGRSINDMTSSIGDVAASMNEMTGGLQELSAGTSQVTEALDSMVSITTDVRESSVNIKEKSGNIDNSVNNLSSLARQNSGALEETSTGINEITAAVTAVAKLGNRNTDFLEIMDSEIELFKTIDVSDLKSVDGQPLIMIDKSRKEIPPRPDNPEQYPESDHRRWWELEFGGWGIEKLKMPESEADGIDGKKIIALVPDAEKPYFKAYCRGMQKYADHFNIDLETLSANRDSVEQGKQLSQVIKKKPDLVIYVPVDIKGSTEWLEKLYKKRIPVIVSNRWPQREGYKYILSATGPDHWGLARLLARTFANLMNKTGEYCLGSIAPGSAVFYARAYGVLTELTRIAPDMKCLDIFDNGDNKDAFRTKVREWAAKYGKRVKGVVCGNDLFYHIVIEEFANVGCRPEIIVAYGNSAKGMQGIKDGILDVETMQSAESAGALPLETAIEYFNGLEIQPIKYLPRRIITRKNVENYLPAQW